MASLFFCTQALAFDQNDPADPRWRALLHFGGKESSAERGEPFFLSPEGYRDPAAELAATIRYFDEHVDDALCRFPARALFLGRGAPMISDWCTRWHTWADAFRPKGAELVFASAFLSSPSSMYGHSMLKFPRKGDTEGLDLPDYTVSYGADTGSVVGLPYVWKGLTGGFSGRYDTAPFYLKVREYNYVENRDFWIYPLEISGDELHALEAHVWELRNVRFPYFFLHRNCAFYLLELLETIRPGTDFTGHFPFWTVPVDTIRLLRAQGLLGKPRFRPSRYRRLKTLRDALSGSEAGLAERLTATTEELPLPPGREAAVLDAAYELWRYRNEGKVPELPGAEAALLQRRAKLTDPPPRFDFTPVPPEDGHPSSRVYAGGGTDRRNAFAEVGYRGTLHDLLAASDGYEEHGELSMGDLRARVQEGELFLERFDLLRLRALAPRERWIPRTAWSFRTGYTRTKELACTGWACAAAQLEGGMGLATQLGPLLAFGLFEAGVEAARAFDRGWRLGAGPSGGLFLPMWAGARFLAEGEWRWRLAGSLPRRSARAGIAQTFSRTTELRATAEVSRGYREALAQLALYF